MSEQIPEIVYDRDTHIDIRTAALRAWLEEQDLIARWWSGINNDNYGFGGVGIRSHRDARPGAPEGAYPDPAAGDLRVDGMVNTNSSWWRYVPAARVADLPADLRAACAAVEAQQRRWEAAGLGHYRPCLSTVVWHLAPPPPSPHPIGWLVAYVPEPADVDTARRYGEDPYAPYLARRAQLPDCRAAWVTAEGLVVYRFRHERQARTCARRFGGAPLVPLREGEGPGDWLAPREPAMSGEERP